MSNDDERDRDEERYNAGLLRNPDGEPEPGADDNLTEAIIVTAGEWWDHYGTEDPDDIMSVRQRAAICRALALFREHTGELSPVADRTADGEPDEENPDAFREIQVTLTVQVPLGETATAAEVGEAINGALDETTQTGLFWGQWVVGSVTAKELLPATESPGLTEAAPVEIGLSRPGGALARDVYLAAVTLNQVTPLTLDGHVIAAVVSWPAPDHSADVAAYLAEQLDRDDATLAEIAVEATKIATGAETYTPLEDDEDDPGYLSNWDPEPETCEHCHLPVTQGSDGIWQDPDCPDADSRYCDASPDHQHHPAVD